MKKRFKEEKKDFPHNGRFLFIKHSLLAILFLSFILINNVCAQTPIKGFCRYSEIQVPPDQTNFSAVDYTFDGYRGFIVYNNLEKKYAALTYDPKSKIFKPSWKNIAFFPGKFLGLGEIKKGERIFAFSSRRDRIAGKLAFSKNGSLSFLSKIKFDSYPENIDVSDIDKDGKKEILVSGPAFNGLSIINESKKQLSEMKVVENRLFKYAAFIDLDFDSFPDIAAVDLLTNSLCFFYNDQSGGFTEQRSFVLDSDAANFQLADLNSDGFDDILFLQNGKIKALLGDSVSTFQKKEIFDPGIKIDKYAVFDFNGDGYNDIAFLNTDEGILGISFAESTVKFYPPLIYFKRKGAVDLTAFVDRGGRKLAILDKTGKIYLIDKIISGDDTFTVAAGLKPGVIGTFDYLNDRSFDLYVIDEQSQQIGFYLSARSNLFNGYFGLNLSQNHVRVAVDDIDPNVKTFCCYSPGERMIEIVRADFTEEKFSKRILYTDGPIEDLKLSSDKSKDRQTIFVLVNSTKKLSMQSFEFHDFRYMKSALDSIAVRSESSAISLRMNKEIFFITKYDSTLYLNKVLVKDKKETPVNILSIPFNKVKNISYEVVCFSDKDFRERPVFGIISKDNRTNINVLNRGYYKTISIENFSSTPGFVKYYDRAGYNELFLFDKEKGLLKSINLRHNFNVYTVNDVFESKNIISYISARINSKKEFLIYTDTNNLINLRTIQ